MTINLETKCFESGLCEKGQAIAAERGIDEFDAKVMCIAGCATARCFADGFNDEFDANQVAALVCGIEAGVAFKEAGDREDEVYA